jgi:hypothetical protein
MEGIGVLILFAALGAFICAKARVAGGAVVFSLLALALFISTPAGQELPAVLSDFVATLDTSTGPVLDDDTDGGAR